MVAGGRTRPPASRCVPKGGFAPLFQAVSSGRSTVSVRIEGHNLGGKFSAPMTLTVTRGKGPLPRPLRPTRLNPEAIRLVLEHQGGSGGGSSCSTPWDGWPGRSRRMTRLQPAIMSFGSTVAVIAAKAGGDLLLSDHHSGRFHRGRMVIAPIVQITLGTACVIEPAGQRS